MTRGGPEDESHDPGGEDRDGKDPGSNDTGSQDPGMRKADGASPHRHDPLDRSRFSAGHLIPIGGEDSPSHGHSHGHGLGGHQTATGKHRKKLILVLSITASIFVVQVIGALISNSLALLADAAHMLTDATGVTIALLASLIATRPTTARRTFGYQRAEVLAALLNGLILCVISVWIFVEAVRRFGTDIEIHTGPMLIAAVIGALANLISLLILRSGQKESLNIRGAYLEVLGDLLGSVAVIVAGLVILVTGWTVADQVASIVIALMIFPRAVSLLKDVVHVLLEATPKDLDLDEARAHMLTVPGVLDVHDMHAWTITSGVPVFSAHVVVEDEALSQQGIEAILDELHACIGEHFDTSHTTFQIEPATHVDHEAQVHL